MGRSKGRLFGLLFAFVGVVVGVSSLAGGSASYAQTPAAGDWQRVPVVAGDVEFRNVFMASTTTGIVVGKHGERGVAYDLEWTPLEEGRHALRVMPVDFAFRAPLSAAVVVNEVAWAVGEQGLIVRKQNGTWSEVASPVPDAHLVTLQMLGNGEEGWAGGYRGGGTVIAEPVLLHYKNGRWEREAAIEGQGEILALHFAEGAGWAVGSAGIWRYDGGVWTQEQEPNPCPETRCFQTYSAVRAVSSDEAWIAGSSIGLCGICISRPYVLHRESGRWQIAMNGVVQGDPTRPGAGRELYGLTRTGPAAGTPAQAWAVGTVRDNFDLRPYILSHTGSQATSEWSYVAAPGGMNTRLTSVSAPDSAHAVAVGTGGAILSFGYGQQSLPDVTPVPTSTAAPSPTPPGGQNPTQRVPDPGDANVAYFELVGHTLRGVFREYWRAHGGLAQFGYPLTEEFAEQSSTDGKTYVTQYFERARFEYHPENAPPYDVLLGLLGRTITQGREGEEAFRPRPPNPGKGGPLHFPETGHFMAPQLTGYWLEHGGLPVYGYPISEAFTEVSPTDGKPYLVQYFERNRLEYHPELSEEYRVSLGLLGVQVLQARGWIGGP